MRKLILRNFQSPGDAVVLTAALRDLHRCHPGEFLTDIRTSSPAVFEHNPYVTPLDEADPDVEVFVCDHPLIHRSNAEPHHFLNGFVEDMNRRLGLNIRVTEFKGDVRLSPREKEWFAAVESREPARRPFWIFASGGKYDYTVKWWDPARYQRVVDHFRGRLDFVQIGQTYHHHPRIDGAVDLLGLADLRQLIRLMYHADGVVSAISLLMHLAAAVEARPGLPNNRPCVVIAGGREPPHWEAYPHHQFIHTVGALPCCAAGGCWKSRVTPLWDGHDRAEEMCVDPVGDLPRCLDLITAEDVIRRIELYYDGGILPPLSGPSAVDLVSRRDFFVRLTGTPPPAAAGDRSAADEAWIAALDALDARSEIERRPGVDCSVTSNGQWAAIHFLGDAVRAPARAAGALRFIAATPRFSVRDIDAALSDASKLTLIRRLVREGLLQVAAEPRRRASARPRGAL